MNRTRFDHRLARLGEPLVVPAVPPIPAEPGKRPLHHPAPGQLHVPLGAWRTTHHLDPIAGLGLHHPAVEVVLMVLRVRPQQIQPSSMFGGQTGQHLAGEVPSSADATDTTTTSSNPSVSTMIWRFRPVIFLPPS